MKYLGIDGGGTKTAFIQIDDIEGIVSYSVMESCHYRQVGLEKFEHIIEEGITEVCRKAGTHIDDITYAFLGLPGYGENPNDAEKIDKIIGRILKGVKFTCGNDVVAGWAGSLACQPGINIVAGTGAIGMGIDNTGKTARASGWGPFCGDEGSAYWLGKKTIELFAKESDGRLNKTKIYEIIKKDFKLENDFEIIDLVVDKYKMDRGMIAKLALTLFKAAEAGDAYAEGIYFEAAQEHILTIKSILNQLDFNSEEKILISYSGGVFNAGKYILKPLKIGINALNNKCEIIKPILKPVTGAALYAVKLHKKSVNRELIKILEVEEKNILSN